MHERSTAKFGGGPKLAVRTLRAEVVEGPDAGVSRFADDERLAIGTARGNDLVLGDETVSRFHVLLRRADSGIVVVDQKSTNGTWIGGARLGEAVVAAGTVVQIGRTRVRIGEGAPVDVELFESEVLGDLRGRSPSMRRVMAWVRRAAASDASVLLIGESGTGKELVARAIHEQSPRAEGPFVTVDCGALSPTLVASELFGHERGAFTGADRQHVGALEQADGGTIFLDEIGELPRELQPALLGALERRTFKRVGGQKELKVDVRVVAATNRNLRAEVNGGGFRLDLFYRLAVLQLELPSLRQRSEDLPLLVEHFLRELGWSGPVSEVFSDAALAELREHAWPGNVRELRNLVQATLALGAPPSLPPSGMVALEEAAAEDDPRALRLDSMLGLPYKEARRRAIDAFDERYMRALLDRARGNVSQAARDAGLDRSYLFTLLRKAGLR